MMTTTVEAADLPRTLQEAVAALLRTLSQAEKDDIAGMAEGDLIDLHFGLGVRVRAWFRLHGGNDTLLASCGAGNADDASMVIVGALWGRLRH